jgi:uncharacterized membrane protein YoaK (UPF0700 family)
MAAAGQEHERESRADASWPPTLVRDLFLIALAATSGYVDAVSYLGLGGVFTSNMTGNTVLLGLALARADRLAAARSALAVAGFLAGAAGGALVVGPDRHVVWPRVVTALFAIELVTLGALVAGGFIVCRGGCAGSERPGLYALIVFAALAMGLQSIAVRALDVSGVTTTYITGTYTSLTVGLAKRLRRASLPPPEGRVPRPAPHGQGLQAAVVAVYVLAAVAGGVAETHWRLAAYVVPAIAVAGVAAAAHARFRRDEGGRLEEPSERPS